MTDPCERCAYLEGLLATARAQLEIVQRTNAAQLAEITDLKQRLETARQLWLAEHQPAGAPRS